MSKEAMSLLSEIEQAEKSFLALVRKAEEIEGTDSRAMAQALINVEQGSMWLRRAVFPNHTPFGGNNDY